MRRYFNFQVTKAISVENLVTVETLNITRGFLYPCEQHPFYEFTYIEDGSIKVHAGNDCTVLTKGELFLINSGERHYYEADNDKSGSVFIVCFKCKSDFLDIIIGKSILTAEIRDLITKIITEAKNAFVFPFNNKMKLLPSPKFGSQQFVEIYIEELLLNLIRSRLNVDTDIRFVNSNAELEENLVDDILTILKENIFGRITLDTVCKQTYYSKTYLNSIFKRRLGHSIMQYYNILKIEQAKKLLLENLNTTEVSNKLDYDNPAYFVKVFKKHVNMTPSEYKRAETEMKLKQK